MCTISAIRLAINVYFYFKNFISFIVLILGFLIGTTSTFKEAYGTTFDGYGFLVIMLSCFSIVAMIMQRWATGKHNRFLLLFAFILDTICLAALISFGLKLITYTVSPFPADLQADCLLHVPTTYSIEDCQQYLSHPRTTGFRIVWESLYNAKKDVVAFQIMTNIQLDTCCGYFAPMNCTDNVSPYKDPFPTTFYLGAITPEMAAQHTQCGPYPGFYKEQETCTDYFDAAAVVPIVGGCRTDMGVANCVKTLSLGAESNSKGCADQVEVYVASLILPLANFIIASTLFNFISMLYACCLLWKRKETDVFPEVTIDLSVVKDINYKEVPNQFAVLPTRSILSKSGFLPKTAEEIYEERLLLLAKRRAAGFTDLESGETKQENGELPDEQQLIDLNPTPAPVEGGSGNAPVPVEGTGNAQESVAPTNSEVKKE